MSQQILTVVAHSKSGKSVLCSVATPIPGTPFISAGLSGNLMLDAGQPMPELGTQFPVPDTHTIQTEERTSEDGKTFQWLSFVKL